MAETHLVTGAAGLIGFEVTRQLLEHGDAVVALDQFRKGGREDLRALADRFPGRLQVLEVDLANAPIVGLPARRWNTIFHLAAIVGVRYVNENPYETLRVNVLSTVRLLDLAIEQGCDAFLFASSSENYASAVDGGWVGLPTPEDVPMCITDITLPRWSYAASKIAGESAVFGAAPVGGFQPGVLRFHNVYGPRMGPTHVIPEFLERCRERMDPFPVYGYDATRSFLHVDDAAVGVRQVAHHVAAGHGGIYNIGSPEETDIARLAEIVFEVTGFHPTIRKEPAPPGSVKRRVPDIGRLAALGFQPRVPLQDGITDCWTAALPAHAHG